jgi:glyoxylate reductase
MSRKVYVTRQIPQLGIDLLVENGFEVEVFEEDKPIPNQMLLEKVKNVDALLPFLTDAVTKEVIENAANLKIIANYAAGFNNIDFEAADKQKIAVTNTPGVLTDATADLTWALIMAVSKRIVESDIYTREGKFTGWGPMLFLGGEITGKTLGIIGAGRIGTAVAKRSLGFDMEVLYTSNRNNEYIDRELSGRKVDIDELLKQSDYISIHVPLTEKTVHLIDEKKLRQMKNSAFLINTARGPIVDEKALIAALKNNQIAGAGLDVYEYEPKLVDGLTELDNAILLPHIGSATLEARTKMAVMAATNIIEFFKGNQPPNILNVKVL